MQVSISTDAYLTIARATLEQPAAEICGLLIGSTDFIAHASLTANVASDPSTSFEIEPAALIAVARAERDGVVTWHGHFHSHPSGSTRPSATDAAMARDVGKLWLIAAPGTPSDPKATMAAWVVVADGSVEGRFEPVNLRIVPNLHRDSASAKATSLNGDTSDDDCAGRLCQPALLPAVP